MARAKVHFKRLYIGELHDLVDDYVALSPKEEFRGKAQMGEIREVIDTGKTRRSTAEVRLGFLDLSSTAG